METLRHSPCYRMATLALACLLVLSFSSLGIAADGKVNINNASVKELQTLKGIGKVITERIIAYRTENGQFKRIDDLLKVKGIGKGKFEKIKDAVTVD